MVTRVFGPPPGAVRSSRGQHSGFSTHSKIRQRDGPEHLQTHKQMPHDSGIDLVHDIALEDICPAPISIRPESPDDGAISQIQGEDDLNVFEERTAPFVFENTPSAYDKDFPGPVPPELLSFLSMPNVKVPHATPPETINPDALDIATIPDDGSLDTTELKRTDFASPMNDPKLTEGAISEIPFHVPSELVCPDDLEDTQIIVPVDNSLDIEPQKTNLASPMNNPKSPRGAVVEVPLRRLPPRPPPPRSSSSSDTPRSVDTTVDLDLPYGPIEMQHPYGSEWSNIKRLRADVKRLRSQAQQMRRVLRDKQQARSRADDKYFQYVRMRKFGPYPENDGTSGQDQEFERLYHECERLRDECGPLEDDCILLDNDLSYHEFELEKLESKLYERPIQVPATFATSNLNQLKHTPKSQASSIYGGSEIDHGYHPRVYQYLSKLGDLNNLNERLDWHEDEKANLEDEKETRMRVGLRLPAEGQKWLDNYSTLENDLIQQIEKANDEAEALRKQCFAEGLVDEDGEPTDFETRERLTFINDKRLDAGNSKSEFVNFPMILPQPSGKQEEFHDPMLSPEKATVDPRDRINGWLLHQLRMSALEVNRLAITYESKYGGIAEGETWEFNVLEWWYKDGAKEGNGKSGRTIKSVSSGEVTEISANIHDKS
ncbi:uncharacterized protein PAC_03288 [Phialocephala subalpina]|uniref:Uncharacterized protein n=1 Tax=Phialocephala subalpina TaxID=576137 RepID=A0A1L7WKW5_9HELO|nr:uncharacterized protein PAC_03288 [Phialocephala subalpina]